jgi:hypothetical protein
MISGGVKQEVHTAAFSKGLPVLWGPFPPDHLKALWTGAFRGVVLSMKVEDPEAVLVGFLGVIQGGGRFP